MRVVRPDRIAARTTELMYFANAVRGLLGLDPIPHTDKSVVNRRLSAREATDEETRRFYVEPWVW